jgi:hypothetical protein
MNARPPKPRSLDTNRLEMAYARAAQPISDEIEAASQDTMQEG